MISVGLLTIGFNLSFKPQRDIHLREMDVELGLWWCHNRGCLCVWYALSGARVVVVVVVGGSSWWYLLMIGQLLLQLLSLLPHGRQEVGRGLARRRRFLHVVIKTLPHSGEQEREGENKRIVQFISNKIYTGICSIRKINSRLFRPSNVLWSKNIRYTIYHITVYQKGNK